MRRDHFTVTLREAVGKPTLTVSYDGPQELLTTQLTDDEGVLYTASEVDAAFRLQAPLDDDPTGVFSLSHRITGEFLLEVNADANEVFALVDAVREQCTDDDETRYRIQVSRDDDDAITYDLDALFVYDADGELLRQHSLIPSGVEI